MVFKERLILAASLYLLLGFACACSNEESATKANFESALDKYFQTKHECLAVGNMPQDVIIGSMFAGLTNTTRQDALTEAGLLSRTSNTRRSLVGGIETVYHYELTSIGQKAWTATGNGTGLFCYGHRKVAEIERFSVPADALGAHISQVTYLYRVIDLPEWARVTSVQKAFPALKQAVETAATPVEDRKTLVLMDDGWSAEGR